MTDQYLAITMVFTLFTLFMLGYPVAFTLAGVGIFFGVLSKVFYYDISHYSNYSDYFHDIFFDFNLLPLRIWGVMNNFTLLAVPLFIFMGVALEKAGVAERLLDAMTLLFGRMKAGLAFSVVIAGALLAACTGIVGASVVTMGLISLPVMLKRGYQKEFSCGLICASGTLGQIIPPSIVLILLGDIMGVSVGELFVAAVIPGLILVICYLVYSYFFCKFKRSMQIEKLADNVNFKELLFIIFTALLPPGLLVTLVLGSIFLGIASPTEAASVGAFGALALAVCYKKLSLNILKEIMQTTSKLTCMVFMILMGATLFSLIFRELQGDELIKELVLGMPNGKFYFIAMVMVLLFMLGCFLDMIEIIFIVVPILVPIAAGFQLDPLWFAILIAVNLQTSFLTPPLGFSLFYLKGVAPSEIKSGDIYRGVLPFVIIQLCVLVLLVIFPEIVSWLPQKIK